MQAGGTVPTVANAAPAQPRAQRRWSDVLEQAWIWSIVGYTVLRFVIAWGAFSDHGANPWIFGVIDVGTAWPYAKAVALVCRRAAEGDWRGLATPAAVAVVSFLAPYGYLWFAAGEMPAGVRLGLVICVSVLAVAALFGVASKVRRLRRAEGATPTTASREPQATDEVVIDLTGDSAKIERHPLVDEGPPVPVKPRGD